MRRELLSVEEFKSMLLRMSGSGYGTYRKLYGVAVRFPEGFTLKVTKVQGDPHAPPSVVEVRVPKRVHRFPQNLLLKPRVTPLTDYLVRVLYKVTRSLRRKCGLGNSCYLGVPKPSPRILPRSSVEVDPNDNSMIIRFFAGLPARGRRVDGGEATKLLIRDVRAVTQALLRVREDSMGGVEDHVRNYVRQEELREWLVREGYAFFVGDGSILPRKASFSEEPMPNATPFKSPPEFRVRVKLPCGDVVEGMAVKCGVTVITGGAYHGKTTLLEAIQEGIYDHVVGDGRELIVSRRGTILVKAEDGRVVHHVDISSFIRNLPSGTRTDDFSSLDASGSTSMAASINEAVEAGAEVMLLDEDTSATNLLYKDVFMSRLLSDDPIRTLSSQVRSLVGVTGTSVVAVASATSTLLGEADNALLMRKYVPLDATREAREARRHSSTLRTEYSPPRPRAYAGVRGLVKVKATSFKIVAEYGDKLKFELSLRDNPRIVEEGQVRLIAHAVSKLARVRDPIPVRDLVKRINESLEREGFRAFAPATHVPPDLTWVDGIDVVWVLNRLPRAVFKQI